MQKTWVPNLHRIYKNLQKFTPLFAQFTKIYVIYSVNWIWPPALPPLLIGLPHCCSSSWPNIALFLLFYFFLFGIFCAMPYTCRCSVGALVLKLLLLELPLLRELPLLLPLELELLLVAAVSVGCAEPPWEK